MMNPEQQKLLFSLKDTAYGRALRDYIGEQKEEIGDIKKCQSWEETLGKQYALKLLDKVLSFLEDKKTSEKVKNQYE